MENIKCNLDKYWTAKEIAEEDSLIKELERGNIRQCSFCGLYVEVEEFSSEREINSSTFYDICDDCSDKISKKINIVTLESGDYTDYYEEDNDDDDCDDEDY